MCDDGGQGEQGVDSGLSGNLCCSAIGQDSHRFLTDEEMAAQAQRTLILGGVAIPGERALAGNSDADVLLHALTNAISGISGVNILGAVADQLCFEQGVTDSAAYLREALASLGAWRLGHVSFSVEAKRPHLAGWIVRIKEHVATLTGLLPEDIGLTATSGEGLTAFGRGEGIQVICVVTAWRSR
jgi:2-C-methyl-D-erythritol 2,4-cyclodiphosphate synthase